jgi:formate hydrogenlyase subunit 3/multisubunit Na+/H+ antiporter MnhD subunit
LKLPFFPIIISGLKSANYYVTFCLCVVGFISVIYASTFSIRGFLTNKKKFSFRRLIAYSSINNFGLLFIILPTNKPVVTLFYLFSYFLVTLFVFLAYFDIADFETKDELKNFYVSPTNESFCYMTAHKYSYNMFCVSVITISGLPLFGLFFPKFVLLGALLNSTGFIFQHNMLLALALLIGGFFFVYVYYKFSFSGWFTFPNDYLDRFDTLKSDERTRNKKFIVYLRVFAYYILGLAFLLVPYVLYYYIL